MFEPGAPNEKIAKQLSSILISDVTRLGIRFNQFVCWTFDAAATNMAALNSIDMVGLLDIGEECKAQTVECRSHSLDLMGANYTVNKKTFNRLKGAEASIFSQHILGLFGAPGSQSKGLFYADMGATPRKNNSIRWWAQEETDEFIFQFFCLPLAGAAPIPGIVDLAFPRTHTLLEWIDKMMSSGALSGVHMDYLYSTLVPAAHGFDERLLCIIEMQLAVVVDVSLKIRQCTYLVEGDGPLAFVLYPILDGIRQNFIARFATMDYPNVQRLCQEFEEQNIVLPPGSS